MNSGQNREQWGSELSFFLATIGSAVGLGNIWRFSYVAGENGGGAFLLVYAACVLLVGLPLLLAELAIGRSAQTDVVSAFGSLGSRRWKWVGVLGLTASFIILTYYVVIAGWTFKYCLDYLQGSIAQRSREAIAADFHAFISHPWEPVLWQGIFMLVTAAVVIRGVRRGIENTNRILMPLLALLVLMLAGYSLTLGGARQGVSFLFRPDWSALLTPQVYVAALGQAFFSLGVGVGTLVTYGSYLPRGYRVARSALAIAVGDTAFAVVAGLAIFPAVFAFGLDPAQGPTLAFITLPEVFSVMPGGRWFGIAFFALLGAAALTSAVSLLEVSVAAWLQRSSMPRWGCASLVAAGAFLLGLPSAWSFGLLGELRPFGKPILEAIDFVASNLLLPLGGLGIALFIGWGWARQAALEGAGLAGLRLGRWWYLAAAVVAPLAILIILARSLLPA